MYLDHRKGQYNGPCSVYSLYFKMLGHDFGFFGGPGSSIVDTWALK